MKIAYIHKVRNVLAVAIVGVLFGSAYIANPSFLGTPNVQAAATDNVSGFAWSETIGWISFNNSNAPATATSYGVNVNPLTGIGNFSGYAWSETVGWISFNSTDTATCPVAPCQASVNWSTGKVTGWARALAGVGAVGGWDGWIKLSDDTVVGWANNGVKISLTTGVFSGWAWGSDVVGWVDFAPGIAGANVVHGPIPNANTAPTAPTISGPTLLTPGTLGTYSFTAIDPQNDQIRYGIDWNMDNIADLWLPAGVTYVNSGTSQSATHSWATAGVYTFQAIAQDAPGINSVWTSYTVTITTPACANGATNSPSCTQCPSNQAYYLSTCVNCTNGGCTGGGGSASNPTGTLTCSNGATNPLFCNSCPASQTLVGSSCVNNCTNGATNPPACNACTAPQTLVAGVCTSPATTCGNNICEAGETFALCPVDCPMTVQQF